MGSRKGEQCSVILFPLTMILFRKILRVYFSETCFGPCFYVTAFSLLPLSMRLWTLKLTWFFRQVLTGTRRIKNEAEKYNEIYSFFWRWSRMCIYWCMRWSACLRTRAENLILISHVLSLLTPYGDSVFGYGGKSGGFEYQIGPRVSRCSWYYTINLANYSKIRYTDAIWSLIKWLQFQNWVIDLNFWKHALEGV